MTPTILNFQDMISRLERFWAGQGCLIWQPYSEKLGAGTGNPATTLRVLGPEPWRVAYAEPSYRPDDGRFAENPNRMQMHTQYQVILKPDPGNPQELYLDSLRAIGIDLDAHDVRFVEDNWESPALGAWGLGWEVWLDGLEITQFTYFQQAGGLDLDPVSVEITYGLERIAMFLQGANEVWELQWDATHTYGDVLKIQEIEHCDYAFNRASVERLRRLYDLYEEEAKAAIAAGLVVPAYDYVLRCSHTFNLLDTRGAIGVTERAQYFRRMRDMTRTVAEAFVEQRRRLEYPLHQDLPNTPEGVDPVAFRKTIEGVAIDNRPSPIIQDDAADLILEIGVEELPPHDLRDAIAQLESAVPNILAQARRDYGEVSVTAAPRRIVIYVEKLATQQKAETVVHRGPPAERAYDSFGQPTKAAEGFASSKGVRVEDLIEREEDGKRYVYAIQQVEGVPTIRLLRHLLGRMIDSIHFGKSMRWNASNVSFSRPLRWLLALYGDEVVPFSFAGVHSDRTTRGLRPHGSPILSAPSASAYFETIAAAGVIVDRAERRRLIAKGVARVAVSVGGTALVDENLLDEVTDLVEQPLPLLGRFDPSYLTVPAPVLVTVMKKHQRYFPVVDAGGAMLPYFVTVANGADRDPALVTRGNEAVIRARYADAAYFVREDRKRPLADFNDDLAGLTFQERLGSMLDKVQRLEKLVVAVGEQLGLSDAELALARRAACLSKADLATRMVIEMTSLQGVMGEIYALDSGEAPEAARAIREAYTVRPDQPLGPISLALNLANRLDSIAGLFAVGFAPTSSADPFGLRRDALGIAQTLIASGRSFDIAEGLKAAGRLQPVEVSEAIIAEATEFIVRRFYGILRDEGFAHDVTEAVLAAQGRNPAPARAAIAELSAVVAAPDWEATFTAYARTKRIVRKLDEHYALAAEAYAEPTTHQLYETYQSVKASVHDLPTLVAALTALRAPIDAFFAEVLVMAEDPAIRAARLGLVQAIAALPDGIADLTQLQGF